MTIMSTDHNVHLIIRNTRLDDIEKIVKLQHDSFPILARYDNIWHPEELKSHLQISPLGQFVVVEEDGEVVGSASTLIVTLNPEYAEHTWKGITSDPTEIVFMGQIYQHTQNLDTKALGVCYMAQERNSSKVRSEKNDQWRQII
jgi:hypothetical protein